MTVALFAQVLLSHLPNLAANLGCISILASLAPSLCSSPLSPHQSRVHTCLSETDPLGGDWSKLLSSQASDTLRKQK